MKTKVQCIFSVFNLTSLSLGLMGCTVKIVKDVPIATNAVVHITNSPIATDAPFATVTVVRNPSSGKYHYILNGGRVSVWEHNTPNEAYNMGVRILRDLKAHRETVFEPVDSKSYLK